MPQRNWAPIGDDEPALLRLSHSVRAAETVEIVTLPESFLHDVQGARGTGDIARLPFAGDSSIEFRGFALSGANTLTTTLNPASGRHIGIHLDNWDRLPYRNRLQSRRRLCINAGPGARYLLLGSVDALAICRALHPDYQEHHPHTEDIRAYVSAGHCLKCLRIFLKPGEGYIAPTELLPHDGSTAGTTEPSTAAFWLGHWDAGDFRSLL
ncbi:hypothetical protein E6W39_37895 [Kitasatospora acidiphila]|uniref:Uncharacterized protein n=1 Tax=Kitasatospora acidiphila TaxID=2567942 RepID=A0A540WCZ5_9ACTN|nr:hypothetical protein [Kitasatospora acidiphila]TQF06915.1 hypothetical protein E6W39_37895 [Kitasatospora acidiphila]